MQHFTQAVTTQSGAITNSDISGEFADYTHMMVVLTSWSISGGNVSLGIRPVGGSMYVALGQAADSAGNEAPFRTDETYPPFDGVQWYFSDASFGSPAQIDIWLWNVADERRV